jgi:acyl transferase domain-containing protein
LALVASSLEDLRQKLSQARERLEDPACRQIKDVRGLYFFEEPLRKNGRMAFLFPGEASQYPNMLKDLCLHFPEVRAVFDMADQLFIKVAKPILPSQTIFPIPGSSADGLAIKERLWEMGGALEAILTADWAASVLLHDLLEIRPDCLLGHSSGEYWALVASGIMGEQTLALKPLVALSENSERLKSEKRIPEAAMAAVGTSRKSLAPLLEQMGDELYVSNDNCSHQVVIVGSEAAVEKVIEQLRAEGVVCQRLPFSRPYHTPLFAEVTEAQREFLQDLQFSPAAIEVYSCTTMALYPRDAEEIRELVVGLWSRPVEFAGSIEAM